MSEFTSPAVQAMNLIRYIGDQVSESGKPITEEQPMRIEQIEIKNYRSFRHVVFEDLPL